MKLWTLSLCFGNTCHHYREQIIMICANTLVFSSHSVNFDFKNCVSNEKNQNKLFLQQVFPHPHLHHLHRHLDDLYLLKGMN